MFLGQFSSRTSLSKKISRNLLLTLLRSLIRSRRQASFSFNSSKVSPDSGSSLLDSDSGLYLAAMAASTRPDKSSSWVFSVAGSSLTLSDPGSSLLDLCLVWCLYLDAMAAHMRLAKSLARALNSLALSAPGSSLLDSDSVWFPP